MSEEMDQLRTRIEAEKSASADFARKVETWLEQVKKELADNEVRKKATEAQLQAKLAAAAQRRASTM